MKFLYPNFLWALLCVAIPIIIHLFYFRRYKRILFSNTKFLQELKEEKSTKNKLKHLLVLLSRILALIFLVLAFAQPFIPKNKQSTLSEKLISVYIDNSFSMQAEGQGYLLFDEAKNLAKKIIDSYSENNKFQILSNDFEAKHQRIVSKAEALSLVDEIQVGPAIQNKALVKEKQVLSAKNFEGQKVLYQLSDFQLGDGLADPDSASLLNLVRLEPSNLRNIAIEELSMEAPVQLLGQNNKLLVKLSNQSNEEQSGSFQMILNGVPKSLGNYTIAPKDFVIDTLGFTINQEGWNQGQITLNDYPLSFDDDFYFSFYVENQIQVYCIYEGAGEKYPKAVFNGNKQVVFSSSNSKGIDYNLLKDQDLVILSELNSLSTGLSEA
ncbi:MAG: BatA domain-containing protein, partial [Chitinophagales bacterium]|nr:BatA domain-containing protein [Chitinophagales bacterium]